MKEIREPDLSMKNILITFNNASKLGIHHLNDFSQSLLSAKSILFEENDIPYLKKLLTIVSKCSDMFLQAACLLKKLDIKIINFSLFGNIISIPLNEILIKLSFEKPLNFSQNGSGETEYLKSITIICTKFPNLKKSIMDATFSQYCRFVYNLNNEDHKKLLFIDIISNILSSLFQLEINLIWHCTENQKLIGQNLKPNHFFYLLNLIQAIPNSLVQMLITEWMWRAKNCLPASFDLKTPLQKYQSAFLQINEKNFRSSLHTLVRSINSNNEITDENQKIIHFRFIKIIFNEIDLNSKGWIDLNKDAIAIWFTEKGERKVPDVIIFKFAQIYNIIINEDKISFLSKEKLIAFEVFSTSKPMKFEFHCNEIIEKNQAIIFSQRCLSKKISNRKQIIVALNSNKETEHTNSFLNRRIYANKPQNHEINYNEDDPIIENFEREEVNSAIDDQSTGNSERGYRIKIMSFDDIVKSLDDLQILSTKMINDLEKKVMTELNKIISFTETNIKELHTLSQKHQNVVEDIQLNELTLEKEAYNFANASEKSFNMIDDENKDLFDNFVDEICRKKTEFIDETDRVFTNNALTSLSNNLLNMKSHSIKKFNNK